MNKSNFKARMNWINLIREYRAELVKRGTIKPTLPIIESDLLKLKNLKK